jgi:branched-chain amino acid transport system substrate-binding protein
MNGLRGVVCLAGVLTLALTSGCGSDNGGGGGGSESGGGTIKIGTTIALSGAVPLTSEADGYREAIKDANAEGGVTIGGKKRKLELKVLDNRSDANTATQQLRTLALKDKVSGILGACCQQNITGAQQADALKVPYSMCCLPLELAPPSKGSSAIAFQTLADAAASFFKVAATAETNKKMVIVTNNDPTGPAATKLFSGAGKGAGFETVSTAAVPPGTTDFADVIKKARGAGAEVLVTQMVPPDCFALWKQMKALNYKPKVAIGLQCAQTPGWAQLGALGDGTLVVMHWLESAGLPFTDKIVSGLGKKYPNPTELAGAAAGYNAAQVLIAAIKEADSTDRAKIAQALQRVKGKFALGDVAMANGRSKTGTYIGQWKGGKIDQVFPQGSESKELAVPPSGLE